MLVSKEEILARKVRIQHEDGSIHEYVPVDHIEKIKPKKTDGSDRPVGKWTEEFYEDLDVYTCTNCGAMRSADMIWPYCPMCGADMKAAGKRAAG